MFKGGVGFGVWGLGIGDWAQSPNPHAQTPKAPFPYQNEKLKEIKK